jgi:hypothetical protein
MSKTKDEYTELEVAIYDLRTANNKLRKDMERLDFILKNCTIEYDRFYSTSFENRDEIDQAMEDAQ